MAHISGDAGLLHAFAAGEDVHRATAAEVFGRELQRSHGGGAPLRQGDQLRPDLRHERVRPGAAARSRARHRAGLHRQLLQPLSRRRAVHGAHAGAGARAAATSRRCSAAGCGCRRSAVPIPRAAQGAERAAINAPMQGTAADLIKLSMIAVQDWLDGARLATRIVMQVHDELVLEVPEGELDTAEDEAAGADGRRGRAGGAAGGRRGRGAELGAGALKRRRRSPRPALATKPFPTSASRTPSTPSRSPRPPGPCGSRAPVRP